MNKILEQALRSDLALTSLENDLLQQARILYQMGFTPENLSSSQMAAVAECIYTASNCETAKGRVKKFLTNQLNKLKAKAERSGKATSWALPRPTGGGGETLGQTLMQWIENEKYLEQQLPANLNRLEALRYFWSRFHGLYRYQAEMQQDMPLQSLQKER